ncbi:MAG: carbohydrate kinase [Pseudomonadota bacterium]
MTILVCGEALYDVFFEEERAEGFTLDARIGGSAFNVATGLGRLGQSVGLLTGVSNDRLGDKLVSTLANEGVATRFLARKDATTTLAMVSLNESGSASYQFYGKGAADRQVTPADLPPPGDVSTAVFGCFSILTEPTGQSFETFAGKLAAAGGFVVFDPNVRPTVEPDLSVWRNRVDAFAAHSGLIKVSAEDLDYLYPGETLADIAGNWLARGVGAVVVTRAGDGATLLQRGGSVSVEAPVVEVVDTVGAGDSFLAALLAFLGETDALSTQKIAALTERDIRAALTFAARAAAVTCSRRGANLPRRDELPS